MIAAKRRRAGRAEEGILGQFCLLALIIIGFALGALALETGHVVGVTAELSNAADAAAIAGAQQMMDDPDLAEYHALTVAALHRADGREVSSNSPDTSVTVVITQPTALDPGRVQVTAEMQIENTLARIFQRSAETVVVTSSAAPGGMVRKVFQDQLFPLAVAGNVEPAGGDGSSGSAGSDGNEELFEYTVGQPFTLNLDVASPDRNAAFTGLGGQNTANMNVIKAMMDQALGLQDVDGTIPAVEVGQLIAQHSGTAGAVHLAQPSRLNALLNSDLVLPIVISPNSENFSFSQPTQVVGFFALDVTNVTVNRGKVVAITGTIIDKGVKGINGEPAQTEIAQWDEALRAISPSTVRLVWNTDSSSSGP